MWGLIFLSFVVAAVGKQNLAIQWSQRIYGPDGPWNAITVSVGGNESYYDISTAQTKVDLLPGGAWECLVLAPDVCDSYSDSQCGRGGFWTPAEDEFSYQIAIEAGWGDGTPYESGDNDPYIIQAISVYANNADGNFTTYNASLATIKNATIVNPDGSTRGPELGFFSLGNQQTHQTFTTAPNEPSVLTNIMIGGLYNNGDIPSYSFGLHSGSAALGYPGSLVLGGYDKSRMIGPITTFTHDAQYSLTLLDIGIGVETGASPFSFTDKSGLLTLNNSKTGQLNVGVDPQMPYFHLPDKTCQALAKVLPIEFDNTLKYYLWKTSDPSFQKIINSPAYLSLTFPPATGESDNVIIKVPFSLLNLTLDIGITDTPTPYFPCLDTSTSSNPGDYRLGRAFLQAAFFGANLRLNSAWIAQAPGPGTTKNGLGNADYEDLDDSDQFPDPTAIVSDTGAFNRSWTGYWTPLPVDSNGSSSADHSSSTGGSSGLSTGAKAGIGVGVAVGGILLIAAAVGAFLLARRRRNQRDSKSELADTGRHYDAKYAGAPVQPMQQSTPSELHAPELLSGPNQVHEMPAQSHHPVYG
ncbi:hypothetical protein NA57DRAFT_48382 [Rhizodiscina lignyota]|uniref:Peptidase A1 domain-containing protein n=1 Tax=Rhizodiscina lignyota TaxID=1504668 RepID=A0A9P4I6P8_9PEZI|nr:hypothetical protein NA57DRAFT_48382 [Rhizodiscina lignyota]